MPPGGKWQAILQETPNYAKQKNFTKGPFEKVQPP